MSKREPVTWVALEIAPVWHLVGGTQERHSTRPLCGGERIAIVHRQDGDYCRYCISLEGGLI